MTKEQAIEVLHELDGSLYETQQVALDLAIKALEQETVSKEVYDNEHFARKDAELQLARLYDHLKELKEQQTSEDVMAIHTQGLEEGIRCAMCTNTMKSDRGCNGDCRMDEDMYKKVMDTIRNLIFEQPTSNVIDCVSRQAVKKLIMKLEKPCDDDLDFYIDSTQKLEVEIDKLPPVTPTRKVGKWKSDGYGHIFCTACNEVSLTVHKSKFCPYCGADMRGSENG